MISNKLIKTFIENLPKEGGGTGIFAILQYEDDVNLLRKEADVIGIFYGIANVEGEAYWYASYLDKKYRTNTHEWRTSIMKQEMSIDRLADHLLDVFKDHYYNVMVRRAPRLKGLKAVKGVLKWTGPIERVLSKLASDYNFNVDVIKSNNIDVLDKYPFNVVILATEVSKIVEQTIERFYVLLAELEKAIKERIMLEKRIKKWVAKVVKRMKEKGTVGALKKMLGVDNIKELSPETLAKKYVEGSTLLKRRINFALNILSAKGDSWAKKVKAAIKRLLKKDMKEASDAELEARMILDFDNPLDIIKSFKENFYLVSPEVQRILLEKVKVKIKKAAKGSIKKILGISTDESIKDKYSPHALVNKIRALPKDKQSKAKKIIRLIAKAHSGSSYWRTVDRLLRK